MKKPLVSVIIPVFNQERFLEDTLNSVISQTYEHREIILVDDGSTDRTPQICQRYQQRDPHIHVYYQANKGPANARNEAILRAKGEYVCLLDSDDLMDKHRIEKQICPFLKDSSIDVVYTSVYLIDAHGKLLGTIKGESLPPPLFHAEMFFRNLIPGPSLMAKRACFLHEPYNNQFVHAEDYEQMLRLLKHYHFFYLDEPLTYYRRHGSNLSENRPAHRAAELKALNQYPLEEITQIVQATNLPLADQELLLGKILFNKELFHPALDHLRKNDSALSLFYQGNCFFKIGKVQEAKECFEKSLELDPQSNPACYNNLAILEDGTKAQELLRCALVLQKDYLDASNNLKSFLRGTRSDRTFTFKELRQSLIPYTETF